jgi:hypothetical protein
LVIGLLAVLSASPALAQETITNVMSPVVSYQYYDSLGADTNSAIVSPVVSYQFYDLLGGDTNSPVMSPVVSFQYYDANGDLGTDSPIVSPIVSYQYFDWPGSGILQTATSPLVSYFYATGGASLVVSAGLSRVLVSPGSLPADGQSNATVTVRLLDGNGNPVAGKLVRISAVEQASSGGVATLASITQPASPTDNNGQATATLTSVVAGTVIILAQDVTDGISLLQATVQFTSALVSPGPDLRSAIMQLAASSSNLLTHSIVGIATEEGGYGDYFQTKLSADKLDQGVNVLATAIGVLLPLLAPESESLLREVAKDLGQGFAPDALLGILDWIAGNSTGLTRVGQKIDSSNASLERDEFQVEQQLLSGVPQVTASYTAAYQNDLALRAQADNTLREILSSQRDLLLDLQLSSELRHVDVLSCIFKDINVVVTAAGVIVTLSPAGGIAADIAVDVAEGLATYADNQRNLNADQQGYNTAVTSLANCSCLSELIDANTKAAFDRIAQGRPPDPITGSIVSVDSVKTYEPLSGIIGDLSTWAGETFAHTEYVHVDNAYSVLTISNTSPRAAVFKVSAFYWHTFTVSDQLAINNVSIAIPRVIQVAANIGASQSAAVRVDYFDGASGAAPDDGSTISFDVLGSDGSSGLFAVGHTTSIMRWEQLGAGVLGVTAKPNRGPVPQDDGGSTNLFGLETPIKAFVYQNPSNQTYQAQIWVVNPFAVPLLAMVAQPLPPGLTVVTTDGFLGGGWIVWTNTIGTNGLVEQSFSFTLSMPPGAGTNLPAPTLVFSDGTGTNSLTLTAVPASFSGLFPVGVSGVIPGGTWGVDISAQLTVTNFTAGSQAGSLVMSVTDTNGSAVTNFSLTFSVNGLAGTNLGYTLPGTLAPGAYIVSGLLSMGGGSGRVFSGTYMISAAPVRLGWGPGAGVLADGFALQLQGTAGYGYLIQTSTNLVDWQPAQYLVLTNSSGYFTDYYAPYYGQRFYRALTVSQPQ